MLDGIIVCASIYVIGGCHGLAMAWSQPSRMRYWARLVDLSADRVNVIRAEIELERWEARHGKVTPVPAPDGVATGEAA